MEKVEKNVLLIIRKFALIIENSFISICKIIYWENLWGRGFEKIQWLKWYDKLQQAE